MNLATSTPIYTLKNWLIVIGLDILVLVITVFPAYELSRGKISLLEISLMFFAVSQVNFMIGLGMLVGRRPLGKLFGWAGLLSLGVMGVLWALI
jgi:hypothetical protein